MPLFRGSVHMGSDPQIFTSLLSRLDGNAWPCLGLLTLRQHVRCHSRRRLLCQPRAGQGSYETLLPMVEEDNSRSSTRVVRPIFHLPYHTYIAYVWVISGLQAASRLGTIRGCVQATHPGFIPTVASVRRSDMQYS